MTLPFVRHGYLPLIPAKIEGVDYSLVVDTGANNVVLSAKRAQRTSSFEPSYDVTMVLGAMSIELDYAFFIDTPLSAPEDGEINGVIGTNVLRGLDYRQGEHSIGLSLAQLSCSGQKTVGRRDEDWRIFLDATIDRRVAQGVLLDTGSAVVLLSQWDGELAPEHTTACTFSGCSSAGTYITTINEVCVDNVCEMGVRAAYPLFDAIGQSWLSRRDFIVSIRDSTLQICE